MKKKLGKSLSYVRLVQKVDEFLSSYSDLVSRRSEVGSNSWRGQSIEQTTVQDAFPNSSLTAEQWERKLILWRLAS